MMSLPEPLPTTQDCLPFVVDFEQATPLDEFAAWYLQHESQVQGHLLRHGAVLFRNLGIHDLDGFDRAVRVLADQFMDYVDGFSPRTKLSSSVYTSTEYDADFFITLHNELSYSARWPAKLFFACLIPPATGGETAIADGRRIVAQMNPDLLDEIERKGVRYVRNLHAGGGPGPSWQQTYETRDPAVVEAFCRRSQIEYTWRPDGGIKLVQYRPATIVHPVTAERVWFNQVDQFHPCHFEPEIYETLMAMYDQEEDLPMYGSFGDGTPISPEAIREIRATVDGQIALTPWRKGDLLLVDNVLVCHGRMPFTGNRKIVVAMS